MPPNTAIVGASTSVTAFIGRADRGTADTPMPVTSFAQYSALFGGLSAGSTMSYAVSQFFENGGGSAVIVRTAGPLPGDAAAKTGMYALDNFDFNLLCIPPESAGVTKQTLAAINDAALAYCASQRAFFIADPPNEWLALAKARNFGAIVVADVASASREHGGVFFPRVLIPDPLNKGALRAFPPSGTVAGMMAATDLRIGVWKAAAGVTDGVLNGVAGLEVVLDDKANGALNPQGINCLRTFPVYGNLVWGARTLAGADILADDYKYIPVRRLALYIEQSVLQSTKWAAFEPNDEALWSALRLSISQFMAGLYAQGAFAGSSASEAYFVVCDASTNPPDGIAAGLVNITIGFAPMTPAEFVILNLQISAGQSA